MIISTEDATEEAEPKPQVSPRKQSPSTPRGRPVRQKSVTPYHSPPPTTEEVPTEEPHLRPTRRHPNPEYRRNPAPEYGSNTSTHPGRDPSTGLCSTPDPITAVIRFPNTAVIRPPIAAVFREQGVDAGCSGLVGVV